MQDIEHPLVQEWLRLAVLELIRDKSLIRARYYQMADNRASTTHTTLDQKDQNHDQTQDQYAVFRRLEAELSQDQKFELAHCTTIHFMHTAFDAKEELSALQAWTMSCNKTPFRELFPPVVQEMMQLIGVETALTFYAQSCNAHGVPNERHSKDEITLDPPPPM